MRLVVWPGFILGAFLSLGTVAEAAPACTALLPFAVKIDPADRWELGRGLVVPGLLKAPDFATLFGAPAMQVPVPEVVEAYNAAKACTAAAGKAKRRDEVDAFRKLEGALAQLARVREQIGRAGASFDAAFKILMEQPPSRDQLAALVVLDKARPGGEAVKAADEFLYRRLGGSNDSQAVAGVYLQLLSPLLAGLRDGPGGLGERMYPALAQKRDGLATSQMAAAEKAIGDVPASPDGLRALAALKVQDARLYALIVPPESMASLDRAFAARGDAIQEGIKGQLVSLATAATVDGAGLTRLQAVSASAALGQLSPPRQTEVRAAVEARRDVVLDGMVDAAAARVGAFPASMAGLRELTGFVRETEGGLGQAAGPARMERFREKAGQQMGGIGKSVLPDFQKNLAALPATREGLEVLSQSAAELQPVVGPLPPDLRAQYAGALAQRREAIEAAVKVEDARLAALPLRGATFATARDDVKIEFRNASHAFLTAGGLANGTTLDVTYEEVEGGRVILRGTPQGDVVFERQGGMLVGAGLRLARKGS